MLSSTIVERAADTNMLQVLELNPLTFAPELALKFGELLPSSSSASLRIKLYPSCSFVEEEEDADPAQWDGEEDYDGGYRRAARARFGMGVDGEEEGGVAEGEEEVWEGEWVDVRLVE